VISLLRSSTARAMFVIVATTIAVACVQPKKTAGPTPAAAGDLDLKGAAEQVAKDLASQIGTSAAARTLVIDPILDKASGQQTGASLRVEQEVGPALTTAAKNVNIVPFNSDGAAQSRLVMTGTIASAQEQNSYTMTMALTDRQNGLVIAQSAARFKEAGLDTSPTRFYNDSPSLVRDRSVDGYLRTADTPKGSAADALYIEQLPTAALLADALSNYNAGRWDQALTEYNAAAARPDGQQLRTFNGIYLANVRLGRTAAAEEAFGKIVALGIATNNLAVKLLFRPGSSTDFWPDPEVSRLYPMWIRQIARGVRSSGKCLNVVGHTSRSGSESLNDRLSVSRAETVMKMLQGETPGLASQLKASGVGYRENIVGSGADNASDAIDRRVEFKVVNCGA